MKKTDTVISQLPGDEIVEGMSNFFSLLGDPTRLKIVIALKYSELCVHEISEVIDLSISAVSHQLKLLRTSKMVKMRRDGRHIYYSLDDHHIDALISVANEHVQE